MNFYSCWLVAFSSNGRILRPVQITVPLWMRVQSQQLVGFPAGTSLHRDELGQNCRCKFEAGVFSRINSILVNSIIRYLERSLWIHYFKKQFSLLNNLGLYHYWDLGKVIFLQYDGQYWKYVFRNTCELFSTQPGLFSDAELQIYAFKRDILW